MSIGNVVLLVVVIVLALLWAVNRFIEDRPPPRRWKPRMNVIVLAVLIVWVLLEWLSPGTLRFPR
jgi:hypothetical protein